MHSNFGGNQRWSAQDYQPANEQEVLEILERHRNGHVRVAGAGHSWSAAAVCSDVTLDMSRFSAVTLHKAAGGRKFVRAGAGCTLQAVLDELHRTSDQTLPTLGVIKLQTIAGAISTGTHGSGRPGLSHYVLGMRVAGYEAPLRAPKVFTYAEDDEALKAARCALGCMGVILSVDLETVPRYSVAETLVEEAELGQVLNHYQEHPLTQFALVPWGWYFLVFKRAPRVPGGVSFWERLKAPLCRAYYTVLVDVGFHLGVKLTLLFGGIKWWQRLAPRLTRKGLQRVDDAEHVLTMWHDFLQHEEMELFVPQSKLPEALEVCRYAAEVFDGEALPERAPAILEAEVMLHDQLKRSRGLYTHHYPFSIRRLEKEDALISMGSSANEPLFSISVFTYQGPDERQGYYAFCAWLARATHDLHQARLHWGKHFPLGARETASSYPRLEDFRNYCRKVDPCGVFGNHYTAEVLGLAAGR